MNFRHLMCPLGLYVLFLSGFMIFPLSAEGSSGETSFLRPRCENLLTNLTKGAWVSLSWPFLRSGQTAAEYTEHGSKLDAERRTFWLRAGFPANNFKSSKHCGFRRTRSGRPQSRQFGQWCNPNGSRPCCSNTQWGVCLGGTSVYCNCSSCVDSRKYHHASLRQWQPDDARCHWHNYTRDQACNVIDASPYDDIYYVGDSYARSMYSALLMILTDREITGAWRRNMTKENLRLCADSAFTNWKDCRQLSQSFDDMKFRNGLCGGRNITFRAQLRRYYNKRYAGQFLELVKRSLGKNGTLLLVSVGFHERYSAANVAGRFLEPALRLIRVYYASKPKNATRWPDIKYMLPMRLGLMRPVSLLRSHGAAQLARFEVSMKRYCSWSGIDVLNFQELGSYVHSYDGVHYDLTVNKMKNQVLLNHIANLSRNLNIVKTLFGNANL